MATINFNSFKSQPNVKKGYKYADLHLDLVQQAIPSNFPTSGIIGKDIALDYDLSAIYNSLTNLFNTLPGQRVLLPNYGLNLLQYVFLPISKEYGRLIGDEIINAIEKWEPRVFVERVDVVARPDDNEYDISIALYLPAFKEYTKFAGTINNKGFATTIKRHNNAI